MKKFQNRLFSIESKPKKIVLFCLLYLGWIMKNQPKKNRVQRNRDVMQIFWRDIWMNLASLLCPKNSNLLLPKFFQLDFFDPKFFSVHFSPKNCIRNQNIIIILLQFKIFCSKFLYKFQFSQTKNCFEGLFLLMFLFFCNRRNTEIKNIFLFSWRSNTTLIIINLNGYYLCYEIHKTMVLCVQLGKTLFFVKFVGEWGGVWLWILVHRP